MDGTDLVLQVRALHHAFQDGPTTRRVLHDVSVHVGVGEMVAITGRSGSGKTTLLHIATALLTPDEGDVEVCGHSLTQTSRGSIARIRREHIGLSSPQFGLHPKETVAANVELPLLFQQPRRPTATRRAAVAAALERVGQTGLASQRAATLSTGQAQRVSLARAIVTCPALLVVDEPTAALDEEAAAGIVAVLKSVASEGTGVLVATHDMQVSRASHRVLRLRDARLEPWAVGL